jgi:hypothetical protein
MFPRIRFCLLSIVVLSAFSIGWRTTDVSLRGAVSMSLQDTRLFVSDPNSGIHVYDVSDPSAPRKMYVVSLRGNRSTAVRDDIVYANGYEGLYTIRVTDESYQFLDVLLQTPEAPPNPPYVEPSEGFGCACGSDDQPVVAPESGGTGSSYATFAAIDEFLYYVDGRSLVTLYIGLPDDPAEISRTHLGQTLETLFPTDDYLFVGGTTGMYIYDRSVPGRPAFISGVQHFRACDPVVVSGATAFVTLRGGNRCGESRDVLLCIDITDPAKPKVLGERPMDTPFGMAVDDTLLYVSTGDSGFELLDVSDPGGPALVRKWRHGETRDFIWGDDVLYVMNGDNVAIYDVASPDEPILRSRVE